MSYDDGRMVYDNPQVRSGLDAASFRWAWTAVELGNWFPLTRLSHLGDVTLHGLDPRGHHLTSLLIHAANAALLFLVLRRLTGAAGRSAVVALLFALHPQRVEVVAWVSERNEELAFLLGMLALAAYERHVRRPGPGRLAIVALLFAAGLLAKPVLVTLPFVLLLLDVWPLGRAVAAGRPRLRRLGWLALEKTPLFAVAAAGSAVAWYAQHRSGATTMLELPLAARAANAAVAYARYLGATVWPADLAVFYPHPGWWPAPAVAGAVALLAGVSFLALAQLRRRPFLAVGWCWFLGTLVPMIGLVQTGWQSLADRYTYLPFVGLGLAAAWGGGELVGRRPRLRPAAVAALALVLVALAATSRRQAATWKDSRTLFTHALAATGDNWLAHQNLGALLVDGGEPGAALAHLAAALRARPDVADIWYNVGCAHLARRAWPAAVDALRQAIALDPGDADYHGNLGVAYSALGRVAEAAAAYRRALAIDPGLQAVRIRLRIAEAKLRGGR